MLQQTRVETVERYYAEFLARFPDVATMAAADESEVLAAWSGLGYYRRARLLHRGAAHVMAVHGGRVPSEPEALRAIPGVGPYTAGAIGSIAFDQPTPLVDGNVARVLSRIDGIVDLGQQAATASRHWGRVARILERGEPRVLAQALMELGATVCTPRAPSCPRCPVRGKCRAHAEGTTAEIPAVKVKKASPVQRLVALHVVWRGQRLFERLPEGGLLGGLWCLPLREVAGGTTSPDDAAVEVAPWLSAGPRVASPPYAAVRHVFTHRVWDVRVVEVRAGRKPRLLGAQTADHVWLPAPEVPDGGIPTLTRKLMRAAQAIV
jgi:A/G-specific adenine glycosylase